MSGIVVSSSAYFDWPEQKPLEPYPDEEPYPYPWWGIEGVGSICPRCSAIVAGSRRHIDWHRRVEGR